MNYISTTTKFESTGNKIQGTTNTVEIKDGKGYKLKEILNAKGKTVKRIRKQLNSKEIDTIAKGLFMPGFWSNCCTKKNLRKSNGRKESRTIK